MIKDRFNTIYNKLNQLKGKRDSLVEQLTMLNSSKTELEYDLIDIVEAQKIIQEVANLTQEQIIIHIIDVVNLALDAIPFDEVYKFGMEFTIRANRTICELYFERNGNRIKPIDSSGGGALDIASFGLRLAVWSLLTGKKNNTIILDEPFKFLSKDLRPYSGEMLKAISEKLGIQIILVTHDEEYVNIADKVFRVKMINGVSVVK